MTVRQKKPVPTFASVAEEAEFWDTHDTTDYDWEPVAVQFGKNLSRGITVRFSSDTLAQLRKTAHERGVGPTTLARMWILERLRAEKADTRTGSR